MPTSPTDQKRLGEIMRELHYEGMQSDKVLGEAWKRLRKEKGIPEMTVQQRRYAMRKSFENPRKEIYPGDLVRTSKGIGRVLDKDTTQREEYLFILIGGESEGKWFKTKSVKLIKNNPREMRPRIAVVKRKRHGKLRPKSPLKGFKINPKKNPIAVRYQNDYRKGYNDGKAGYQLKTIYPDIQDATRAYQFGYYDGYHGLKFGHRKGLKRFPKKNPIAVYNPVRYQGEPIPATQIEIRYRRTDGQYAGQWFRHAYGRTARLIGMSNGNVLISSANGKRLWGKR